VAFALLAQAGEQRTGPVTAYQIRDGRQYPAEDVTVVWCGGSGVAYEVDGQRYPASQVTEIRSITPPGGGDRLG